MSIGLEVFGMRTVAKNIDVTMKERSVRAGIRENVAGAGPVMRVRLTRRLAEFIDGVDLSNRRVGDVFELPEPAGRLLLAEGWAVSDPVHPDATRRTPQRSASIGVFQDDCEHEDV